MIKFNNTEEVKGAVAALNQSRKERRRSTHKVKAKVLAEARKAEKLAYVVAYDANPSEFFKHSHRKKTVASRRPTRKQGAALTVCYLRKHIERLEELFAAGTIDQCKYDQSVAAAKAQLHRMVNIRAEKSGKKRKVKEAVRPCAKKPKCDRGAKHHTHKVHITSEQRRKNKLIDGAVVTDLNNKSPMPKLYVVGSAKAVPKINVPTLNAVPISRKERLKAEYQQRKVNRGLKELLSENVRKAA